MKITYTWLQDHLEMTANGQTGTEVQAAVQAIVDKLCEIGFEVESVEDFADQLRDITVALVERIEKHPQAERLHICYVNDGSGQTLQIVCGAQNVRAGMKTALVHVGGIVPQSGEPLKQVKIRNVESCGMLCSAEELNFEDAQPGILDLVTDAAPGTPLASAMGLDDKVLTISVTPNRGDCFSVRGIARELAAAGLGKLKELDFLQHFKKEDQANIRKVDITQLGDSAIPVSITTENCSFFYGATVDNVRNCESPAWLKNRLKCVGQRPINALVDITNFLNFDIGQPLHVYDAAMIQGKITIRQAKREEQITALNKQIYTLSEEMMVVADDSQPLTIAGIMGGESSGSGDNTTRIFFEAALFDPVSVAKTGQTIGLTSESRMRFERGVDPEIAKTAVEYGLTLVTAICGGTITGCSLAKSDAGKQAADTLSQPTVCLTLSGLLALGGNDALTIANSAPILAALGFNIREQNDEHVVVSIPSWRHDVSREEDLIEEILRIRGYNNLPTKPLPTILQEQCLCKKSTVKKWLCNRGFNEVYTLPFLNSDEFSAFGEGMAPVKVLSPLNVEMPFLRPSIIPSLLGIVRTSQSRNYKYGAIYEIESVFSCGIGGESAPIERVVISGVRFGKRPRHWLEQARNVDVFDVKADCEDIFERCMVPSCEVGTAGLPAYYHPGCAGVFTGHPSKTAGAAEISSVLGFFGEVHPRILANFGISVPVVAFEIPLTDELFANYENTTVNPCVLSNLQQLTRDFAFVLDENIAAGRLVAAVSAVSAADPLIQSVQIFDVFTDGLASGKKSVAVQVTIQPVAKTLNEEDLKDLSEKIIANVRAKVGGELRSS
ncbi:MAG: phenylalanine--tRNA ligase subunit beta [Holosporales bacterium]|jgi:phenylalanyl-tRNA synthetase beta chain|nr:phenylalanine--tRNA ligase subunit beta [Holosporales bacterium]